MIQLPFEDSKKIKNQMENCICKVNQKNGKIGIGFLCKIPFPNTRNNLLPVLMVNNNILNENDKIIYLTINNKTKEIALDKSRKKYINSTKNIVIIEIKQNKDKIYDLLEVDENYIFKNEEKLEYNNKSIYIMKYQYEKSNASYEIINDIIENKEISYCSPIVSLKTLKIIGIYYEDISKNNNINYSLFIKDLIDEFNNYKNEIKIIYKTDKEGYENIFGYKFVENNKNNIELIINGIENKLINRYKLDKGYNIVKIIIKRKITNLKYMFYNCKSLRNIKELRHLDTRYINDFSYIFSGCSLLLDIRGLENWDVSKGNNFSYMFYECSSLSDIKGLENWNVSNGNNFSCMFSRC